MEVPRDKSNIKLLSYKNKMKINQGRLLKKISKSGIKVKLLLKKIRQLITYVMN